jgi:hypothetical protein
LAFQLDIRAGQLVAFLPPELSLVQVVRALEVDTSLLTKPQEKVGDAVVQVPWVRNDDAHLLVEAAASALATTHDQKGDRK